MDTAAKGALRFDEFEFDASSGKLLHEGRPVKIERQPLRVLAALLERPGQIVSREQLRANIWGDATFVEFDQNLNYCIRQIRLALRDVASDPRYIETLPKQGYRFIGSLRAEAPASEAAARAALTSHSMRGSESSAVASGQTNRWRKLALIAAGVLLGFAIGWMLHRDRPAKPIGPLSVSLLPPPSTSFVFNRNGEGGFAISPDGTMLAFVARGLGKVQLWVRRLDRPDSRPVPDSESAYKPFWSPDSRSIAFFTPLKLKKSELATGITTDLSDVPAITSGGSWSAHGVIVWGHANGTQPIEKISDAGGTSVPLPGTDGEEPHFLPDGRHFVYRGHDPKTGDYVSRDLWLTSLEPGEKPHRVGEAGTAPQYSAGHIVSALNGTLMAQPFDGTAGAFNGGAYRVNAPLATRVHIGWILANFSVNAAGMLVYPPQSDSLTELRWRDRNGNAPGTLGLPGEYYTPRISPDGRRVAFTRREGANSEIWIANVAAKSAARLTFDPGIDDYPTWSPDGSAITFANDASGVANIFRKAATGNGPLERLTTSPFRQQPLDWSRDGRFLLFTRIAFSSEIMIQAAADRSSLSYLGHARGAAKAQFNPGVPRWIAYDFDDSGRREVYVQAFEPGRPASVARWQVSSGGGVMPRWRGDGKELFYQGLDGKMMAVRVSGDKSAFEYSAPELLFEATPSLLRSPSFEYDVTPDGQRFLMIEPAEKPEYLPLTLVTRWRTN